jgi:Tfp pilus assembly protein PilF
MQEEALMATPFLSSEEYDERAHQQYNEGDYDAALETLREGLGIYPHAVELHIGLGYTRLAREEFAWAKRAFEDALALEAEHEDALVGTGEVLLRLGRRDEALDHFARARDGGGDEDLDLIMTMGRALYRERLFVAAHEMFTRAVTLEPGSAEALAALGYTLHQLGDLPGARRELARALRHDAQFHEARIFLGHIQYDAGDFKQALAAFERVPVQDHWDTVALWRVVELKRALQGCEPGTMELQPWETRLDELDSDPDPTDQLLSEVECGAIEPSHRELFGRVLDAPHRQTIHRVRTPKGEVYHGTWIEIVRQLRDERGHADESVAQFMRRQADEDGARTGVVIPSHDPEAFIRAAERAGLLLIDF